MHIDPKAQIVGWPALKIRDFLQRFSNGMAFTLSDLEEKLQISKVDTCEAMRKVEELGYAELTSIHNGVKYWVTTLKGNALGLASAAKPISRKTADRVVQELLARVLHVNSHPYYLMRVKKVVAFGSYLSTKEKINDVDIGIFLEAKEADSKKHGVLCMERSALARRQGRRFRNLTDEVCWARSEVLLFLKSRSRTISLHYEDEILRLVETRTLFEE